MNFRRWFVSTAWGVVSLAGAAFAATTTVGPVEHGSVSVDVETGERTVVPVCEEQSVERVAPGHHAFERGIAEFELPALRADYTRASLVLWETREVVTQPRPADVHVVSFYAADLTLEVADWDRPAVALDTIVTDANESIRTFRIDVTPIVRDFARGNVGFRVQLADESPTAERDADGGAGSTFAAWLEIESGVPPATAVLADAFPSIAPLVSRYGGTSVVAGLFLGSDALDVSQIDPSSVRLNGAPALVWRVRDVATPSLYPDGRVRSVRGGDGRPDLALFFSERSVVAGAFARLGRRPHPDEIVPILFTARIAGANGPESIAVEDFVVMGSPLE
jgi:hypothetical protein